MTFIYQDLSMIASASSGPERGFVLWHYKTTDTLAEVQTPGYFEEIVQPYDRIMLHCSDTLCDVYIAEDKFSGQLIAKSVS